MSTLLRNALARQGIALEDASSDEHVDATGPVEEVALYEQDLDAGQLVEAQQEVNHAHDEDSQLDVVMEGLKELRSMVVSINNTRGFNDQSLKYLNLATEAVTVPAFGCNPVRYAFEDGGLPPDRGDGTQAAPPQVDISSLEKSINAVENASEETFTARIESERNLFTPIADMIAGSVSRLGSTSEQAKIRAEENNGDVEVDANLAATLFVDGQMPEDIVAYVQAYSDLGQILVGDYFIRALASGADAHSFSNSINFDSKEALWASIGEKMAMIGDPRTKLTEKQMTMSLPGAPALFTKVEVAAEDVVDDVPQLLRVFTHQYRPAPLKMTGDSQASTTPALTLSQIRAVCDTLLALYKSFDVRDIKVKLTPIFDDAAASVYQTRDVLAQSQLSEAAGVQEQVIIDYLKTVYSLTSLPILGFLTNLTIFTNAIVILAQRSFEAEPAPVPVDTVVEGGDVTADPLAAPGEEVPAVPGEEGAAVDEFAPEAGGDVPAEGGDVAEIPADGTEAIPGEEGDAANTDEFAEDAGPEATSDAMTDAIAEGTQAADEEAAPDAEAAADVVEEETTDVELPSTEEEEEEEDDDEKETKA